MRLFSEKATARFLRPAFIQRGVQYFFLLMYGAIGLQFHLYVKWAMGNSAYSKWAIGNSAYYVARPPAVEAFLPISALMAAKRLLLTGQYDQVHPAGLTIFLFAIASALLLRKGFCGYLCPIGTISMLLARLGKRLGISRRPGKITSAVLSAPKYLLLAFFAYIILYRMSLPDIEKFLATPYNLVADSKMLLFFLRPSAFLLVTVAALALGGMIFPAFWCRGFCPYGALLGLFSWLSPVAVRRDENACTACRRCTRACPSRIVVHEKKRVSGPECLGCLACVDACPEVDCLSLRLGYTATSKRLPSLSLAVGTILLLCLFLTWAHLTGNWQSHIAPEVLKSYHQGIERIEHP